MAFKWFKEHFGAPAPARPEVPEVKKEKTTEEPEPERSEQIKSRETPEELILRSREKSSSKKLRGGSTEVVFVELKDDGQGVFKTRGYHNERAAYLIDRFLGLDLVPSTVVRRLDGAEGSMQKFISGAKDAGELSLSLKKSLYKLPADLESQLMKMWIFDLIIQNADRHTGNFLLKDNRLYAIDHGFSDMGLPPPERVTTLYYGFPQGRFFNESLHPDIIETFKKFLQWPQGPALLQELLTETIGSSERAANVLKRIKVIGSELVKQGYISPIVALDL